MSDSISLEMIEAFRDDAMDTLARWESVCLAAKAESTENTYKGLMRCAHNLKGNAALIGFQSLSSTVHRLEDRLLDLSKKNISPTEPNLMALLLEAERYLRNWVLSLVSDHNYQNTDFDILSALEDYATEGKIREENPSATGSDSNSESSKRRSSADADFGGAGGGFGANVQEIHEQVRIPSQKLDVLIQNVGELTLAQAIVNRGRVENRLGAPEVREAIMLCEKITQRLRASVLDLRMLPMIGLYKKLERAALEVSAKLKKPVDFTTSGQDVTVDKAVLNRIFEPLMHLVRNAVDHGIEPIADRVAKGKPDYGTLLLAAEVAASGIIIRLKDDGQGLDSERILKKAVENGIVKAGQKLSEQDIVSLIFQPNFSTRTEVTDISGRGVGLDIVLREIHALGGTLQTLSKPGQGTEFIISLPVNVSLIDVMVLNAGGIDYAVPTHDIGEVVQIQDAKFQGSAQYENMMVHHGGVVPVDDLTSYMVPPLSVRKRASGSTLRTKKEGCILVIEVQGRNYGFYVDNVLGQQQIFARPAKGYLGALPGVTGSTVLSTGDPAMILNIKEIADNHFNKSRKGLQLGEPSI